MGISVRASWWSFIAWTNLPSENYENICYNSYLAGVQTRYLQNINVEYYHATSQLGVMVEVECEHRESSVIE
jgi:hypothetical protein